MGIMPKALLNQPEQHELGGLLYTAFNTLSSSRGYGMGGPLPITISDMAAFCQLFEIADLEDRTNFVRTIQRLDSAYMAKVAARSDTGAKTEVVNDGPAIDNSKQGESNGRSVTAARDQRGRSGHDRGPQ